MRPTAELPERYILCLDDDRDFLKSVELFLPDRINSAEGGKILYRFVFADEPLQALETLTELVAEGSIVAMIITDQQMPSMKGIEFLLRARQITPQSIRILLTGHAGIEAAIGAINEHLLERYLTKPIEDHHDFSLNVGLLLQRFEMSRVIEQQATTLQGLYDFSNQINGMADLQSMRDYVVSFTRSRLSCDVVYVDAPEAVEESPADAGSKAARALDFGRAAGRLTSDDEVPLGLRALVGLAELAPGTPVCYARMQLGESCTGWILAARSAQQDFADHDLQTLGYIADTAAIAIEKRRMWIRLEEAYRVTKHQAAHLEEANGKLALLDRMKGEFLNLISHELRTPLGHLSVISMLDQELGPEEQRELISFIRTGYERLDRFIVLGLEYLDWSGRGRIHSTETADLSSSVTIIVETLRASSDRKIDWEVLLPAEPCIVRMPSAQVADVLQVLLDNALKFSLPEAFVRIEVTEAPGHGTLRVTDRGRGFPAELGAQIFEPFTVLDTTHYEGTGLNLPRIRAMVEAFGGAASAKSSGDGDGASFTIEFPLAIAEARERGAPRAPVASVKR